MIIKYVLEILEEANLEVKSVKSSERILVNKEKGYYLPDVYYLHFKDGVILRIVESNDYIATKYPFRLLCRYGGHDCYLYWSTIDHEEFDGMCCECPNIYHAFKETIGEDLLGNSFDSFDLVLFFLRKMLN